MSASKTSVRKGLVILNPSSGPTDDEDLVKQVRSLLDQIGTKDSSVELKLKVTEGAGDAQRWAGAAPDEGFERVISIGGDGTAMECARGLSEAKSDLPLGIVATGTANVLARALCLPLDLEGAFHQALAGTARNFDLASLPDRDLRFLVGVGIGVPGQMVEKLDSKLKDSLGPVAYFTAFLEGLVENRDAVLDITIDSENLVLPGHSAIVMNVGRFKAFSDLEIGPDASPHDGKLDLFVIDHQSATGVLESIRSFFGDRTKSEGGFTHRRGSSIRIETGTPLSVQVDGEWVGRTPVEIEVGDEEVSLVCGEDYET